MINNYFILTRLCRELNSLLANYDLIECFTQDKDNIVFEFRKGAMVKCLEFSSAPSFPYLNLKENFKKSRKNFTNFFEKHLPAKLQFIKIALFERVILLQFENFSLFILFRGKLSNVICSTGTGFEVFKSANESNIHSLTEEFSTTVFTNSNLFIEDTSSVSNFAISSIKSSFPFLGKEIMEELRLRISEQSEEKTTTLINEIVNEVYNNEILITSDKVKGVLFSPSTFHIKNFSDSVLFPAVTGAISYFLKEFFKSNEFTKKYSKIQRYLDSESQFYSEKLNALQSRIEKGELTDHYNELANLLLINLNEVQFGESEIVVENIFNENIPAKIKLNKNYSAAKNAENYFTKAKSERLNYQNSLRLLKISENKYQNLLLLKVRLEKISNLYELNTLIKEYKLENIDSKGSKLEGASKFRHFVISDKYNLYVGKDGTNNDELTLKFAKQNDYWFHAKSVSGSHVVLRVDNSKEVVPKSVLNKAAAVAAFYSKAKTSSLAPVSYTFKKYVIKRKGMEAGKVALLKESVLMVKPEIPADVLQIENPKELI